MNTRKHLVILIAVMASLASFLAGYLFTRPQQPGALNQQHGDILDRFMGIRSANNASQQQNGLAQIASDPVLSAASDGASDSILYYHRDNGFVSQVQLASQKNTLISSTGLPHLVGVSWSPDATKVLASYDSPNGTLYKSFDYKTRSGTTLGTDIAGAVFSPDSSSIALAKTSGEETDVVIARTDGTEPRTILKTHLQNVSLFWQSDHALSFVSQDLSQPNPTMILFVVTDDGDLTKIVADQPNLNIRWSPDGSLLLYSTRTNDRPELHLLNVTTGTDRTIDLPATADNCAWHMNNSSFVCVAEGPDSTSIVSVTTSDLSSKTLFADLIFSPENVFLSHLEDFVVLVSRTDHTIWSAPLSD